MSRVYHFGDCRIEPERRELRRHGQLVSLPPSAFDFLAYLIEHHERAVGRDELVAAVWGKTEISDTLLGQTVLRLRRELGDDAKEQRLLRTIPRFGYHWVAPLSIGAAAEIAAPATAVAPAPMVGRRPRRAFALLGGALALGVLALGLFAAVRRPAQQSPVLGSTVSSAVLPAEVEASAEWAWTRLGVMDMVASRLRSSGVPSVPSEEVIALLKAPDRNVGVRAATSAQLLIAPHVHRADDGWHVALDAEDGAGQHYSSDAFDADVDRAARAATDKLLNALGMHSPHAGHDMPHAEFIRRVDAAVLADDPDGARRLLDAASPEQRQSPDLQLRLAKLDFRAGKLGEAQQRLLGLLDEAPAQTAPLLRASILNGLGAVAIRDDQPAQAREHFGAAIELLARETDPEQLGQAYLGRAAAAADQHDTAAALADYARARLAFREANDALAMIRVAADEGFLDLDLDRPAQALSQLRSATEGFLRWGALSEAIYTYIGRINCHLALLDGRAAMRDADDAAPLAQRLDNPALHDALALARGRALAAVGRAREARATLDDLRRNTRDAITAAAAGIPLAALEFDSNNPAAANALAARAVEVLDAPGYTTLHADAALIHIRASLRDADAAAALSALAALQSRAEHGTEPRLRVIAALARAEYARHFDAAADWRAAFDRARELAQGGAVPLEIAAVARSYADALLTEGDFAAAEVEVGRVTRWAEQDFACAVLEARLFAALGRDEARQSAVARARVLAGERSIPLDALALAVPARSASQ